MENLVKALEETIVHLRRSEDSFWSALSVQELTSQLEDEVRRISSSKRVDAKRLGLLFAPTGWIQDTAIDNGWGDEFLQLSKVVDEFT